MKKVAFSICIFVSSLAFGSVCHALQITEIMYDLDGTDTDHEWVEVYNNESSSVDLTGWKFSDGANHILNVPPANGGQGTMTLASGEYMIFSPNAPTFLADHSGYSGAVIDTVMSLTNTSGIVALIDLDGNQIETVNYTSDQGGAGDGHSLALVDGSWIGVVPTPGSQNQADSSGSSSTTSATSDAAPPIEETPPPQITADIEVRTPVVSGVATLFDVSVLGYSKEQLTRGIFEWNMGDGYMRRDETKTPFSYMYQYPGEYVVYFSYYRDAYTQIPVVSDTITLSIFSPALTITSVEKDGAVKITNNAKTTFDLSGWSLSAYTKKFIFPKQTSILAGRTLTISPVITTFSPDEAKQVTLSYPSGSVAFSYGIPKADAFVSQAKTHTTKKILYQEPEYQNKESILVDQKAEVLDVAEKIPSSLFLVLFVILIGCALVLGIRSKQNKKAEVMDDTASSYQIIE